MVSSVQANDRSGLLKPVSLYHVIKGWAERAPEVVAITAPGQPALTYRNLCAQIAKVTQDLRGMGIRRNDRVAMVAPNGPDMAVAFLSVAACASCAPLNPTYQFNEFDFHLADLKASALMIQSGTSYAAVAAAQKHSIPVIELTQAVSGPAGMFSLSDTGRRMPTESEVFSRAEDEALILQTSGTTARPKMVALSQGQLMASAANIAAGLQLTDRDCCLNVMPLFHVHGLVGAVLSSITTGCSLVCMPGFDAEKFFECFAEYRPSWYTAVPTVHQAVLSYAKGNPGVIEQHPLRLIRSCSAPLPVDIARELEEIFCVPVIEAYGMTEATHQIASNPLPPNERKIGSVGLSTGTEIAVLDDEHHLLAPGEVGEIVIRGETVIGSYANDGRANEESFTNGWFRTGDQGYLDSDGYLYLVGRLKDIINRGGEKISPYEVESALNDHAAVAEAVVFPFAHETLGEEIGAAVVLKDNAPVTERKLQQFILGKIAEFKIPRRIEIVDQIPKGPTGKLQRSRLAEQLGLGGIGFGKSETRVKFVEPRTDVERRLTELWREVLRIDRIGVHHNFFDLGGHSLLATQIISKVIKALQVELSVRSFFEVPTVAGLAKLIETIRWTRQVRHGPVGNNEKREQGDL